MKLFVPLVLLLAADVSATSISKVKVASVPRDFAPWNGSVVKEPVSVVGYDFEVNKEQSRARVVVRYTYRGEQGYVDNDGLRPDPTAVQVPGLVYDPAEKAVIYNSNNNRTVCGIVKEQKGLFGTRLSVKSTGSCVITSSAADHTEDDGWTLHKMQDLDVFLEVR